MKMDDQKKMESLYEDILHEAFFSKLAKSVGGAFKSAAQSSPLLRGIGAAIKSFSNEANDTNFENAYETLLDGIKATIENFFKSNAISSGAKKVTVGSPVGVRYYQLSMLDNYVKRQAANLLISPSNIPTTGFPASTDTDTINVDYIQLNNAFNDILNQIIHLRQTIDVVFKNPSNVDKVNPEYIKNGKAYLQVMENYIKYKPATGAKLPTKPTITKAVYRAKALTIEATDGSNWTQFMGKVMLYQYSLDGSAWINIDPSRRSPSGATAAKYKVVGITIPKGTHSLKLRVCVDGNRGASSDEFSFSV